MGQRFSKELFHEQIAIGKKYEAIVAKTLFKAGIPVEVPEMKGTNYTRDQQDIVVPPDFVIEVKSRNLTFTSHEDFPYADMPIETVYGWNKKGVRPKAVIFISQHTEKMFFLDVEETFEHWREGKQWDGLRKIEQMQYHVDLKHAKPIEDLIEHLVATYGNE